MRNNYKGRRVFCAFCAVMVLCTLIFNFNVVFAAGGNGIPQQFLASNKGYTISYNNGTGEMFIQRINIENEVQTSGDRWVIFVYMCGSDLESGDGSYATKNIEEMLNARTSENVKVVIQTGGCKNWKTPGISNNSIGRYEINGSTKNLIKKEELPQSSMGDANTLREFLEWGLDNYNYAEHYGFVFWDHGGGVTGGLCVDEINNNDALSIEDVDKAFLLASPKMRKRFDFMAFDTCLMSTIEMANVAATYADYMFASEETEPGCGMDYEAFLNAIADNPRISMVNLGEVLGKSFMESCKKIDDYKRVTHSTIDLRTIDQTIVDLDKAYRDIYNSLFPVFNSELNDYVLDRKRLEDFVENVKMSDNYSNNNVENYTNMVDIGDFLLKYSNVEGLDSVNLALNSIRVDSVKYNINGEEHTKSTGISTFFPFFIEENSDALAKFSNVSPCPSYKMLINTVKDAYANGSGVIQKAGADSENVRGRAFVSNDGQFAKLNSEIFGGYSITTKNNTIKVNLGNFNNKVFYALNTVFVKDENNKTLHLGVKDKAAIDEANNNIFITCKNLWPSVDGIYLPLENVDYIKDSSAKDEAYVFEAIRNDNELINIRVYRDKNNKWTFSGVTSDVGEDGIAGWNPRSLSAGDKITPLYWDYDNNMNLSKGESFVYTDNTVIKEIPLPNTAMYGIRVTDIWGNEYYSEPVNIENVAVSTSNNSGSIILAVISSCLVILFLVFFISIVRIKNKQMS